MSNSCDPTDCSPPGSFVHGILQAGTLEQVTISFPRGSFRARDGSRVSCIGRWVLYRAASREAWNWESPGQTEELVLSVPSLRLQMERPDSSLWEALRQAWIYGGSQGSSRCPLVSRARLTFLKTVTGRSFLIPTPRTPHVMFSPVRLPRLFLGASLAVF